MRESWFGESRAEQPEQEWHMTMFLHEQIDRVALQAALMTTLTALCTLLASARSRSFF